MMKIEDVFQIPGRGTVIAVSADRSGDLLGTHLIRLRDNATWLVTGVELSRKLFGEPKKTGELVGLVLRGGSLPERGDEIERF